MFKTTFRSFVFVVSLMLLGACATTQPMRPPIRPPAPPTDVKPKPKPSYSWDEQAAKSAHGAARIVVNLSEQRVYFYKGDKRLGDTRCSTGKTGFATPAGEYRVTQKDLNHKSNLYGKFIAADGRVLHSNADMSKMKVPEGATFAGAKMPFYQRFTGGYGLHAGVVPNHPASHGCVRLPRVMAAHFFSHTRVGDEVTVKE